MNKFEIVMTQAAEECVEIAQRLSKALRFGMYEVQEGQPQTNHDRVKQEFNDLLGVLHFLDEECGTCFDIGRPDWDAIRDKINKVKKYLKFSEEAGTLVDVEKIKVDAYNKAIDDIIENTALTSAQIKSLEARKI